MEKQTESEHFPNRSNAKYPVITCPSCRAVLKKPKRSLFGKLFIFATCLFQVSMVIWLYVSIWELRSGGSSSIIMGLDAVGSFFEFGIVLALILGIWFIGTAIFVLGIFLTRPR
ncbi:MAG: hypothetical protein PSN37_02065 [Alphaproteobacteria bacterium]|nr:hypothetical protein [Alphaproteobacteria bacterium]